MNVTPRLALLASLLVTACSSSSSSPPDASSDAAKDGTVKDAGVKDTGTTDTGSADAGPAADPTCTAPTTAASNGSCVTLDDAGVLCNPVTNEGCNADAGEACDFAGAGFKCYAPPPSNTAALCASCDVTNGPACMPTATCVDQGNGTSQCFRYCCTDADCTPGHCDKQTFQTDPLGVCVN